MTNKTLEVFDRVGGLIACSYEIFLSKQAGHPFESMTPAHQNIGSSDPIAVDSIVNIINMLKLNPEDYPDLKFPHGLTRDQAREVFRTWHEQRN